MKPPLADAFYEPIDDKAGEGRFRATAATGGPWDPAAQHGGPPSALLARAVELTEPREDMRVARATCEILGAVPVGEVVVQAQVTRSGRSVELVEASLLAGGRSAARMSAWRVRAAPDDVATALSPVLADPDGDAAPPMPARSADGEPPDAPADGGPLAGWHDGYLSAIEWRFAAGAFAEPGPATVWTKARVPLLPGESPSPLQRVMLVADSGNGVSNVLEIDRWWFINPELTVHLFRYPAGEWICVDARTSVAAGGTGLAESALYDRDGRIGRGAQALLVTRRPRG